MQMSLPASSIGILIALSHRRKRSGSGFDPVPRKEVREGGPTLAVFEFILEVEVWIRNQFCSMMPTEFGGP
jgi:hypothetical protein